MLTKCLSITGIALIAVAAGLTGCSGSNDGVAASASDGNLSADTAVSTAATSDDTFLAEVALAMKSAADSAPTNIESIAVTTKDSSQPVVIE